MVSGNRAGGMAWASGAIDNASSANVARAVNGACNARWRIERACGKSMDQRGEMLRLLEGIVKEIAAVLIIIVVFREVIIAIVEIIVIEITINIKETS